MKRILLIQKLNTNLVEVYTERANKATAVGKHTLRAGQLEIPQCSVLNSIILLAGQKSGNLKKANKNLSLGCVSSAGIKSASESKERRQAGEQ